jgi:tetratricopeptide (TPR) repeat protein
MNLMDELLEVESENMRALYLRGRAFYHKKEIPQAFRDFTRALELNPSENDSEIIKKYIAEIIKIYPENSMIELSETGDSSKSFMQSIAGKKYSMI